MSTTSTGQLGTHAAPTGTLTRITLMAPQRRVDLVLPSETPLGELVPEIVRLLGYRSAEQPQSYRVSLLDGRVIEPDMSLRSAGVADGALVRVDRVNEAPLPAVVHDVTDEVADDLHRRPGRWGDSPRQWLATTVIVAASIWATLLAVPFTPAGFAPALGVPLLIMGTGAALGGARTVGTAVLLAGAAITGTSVPSLLTDWPMRWVGWIALIGVTVLAVGAATKRFRAAVTGAGTLFGLLALWAVLEPLGLPEAQRATLLAVVSVIILGVLPRIALITSGLTRLDNRQLNDKPASRASVKAAVDSAHRGLSLAVVFAAASTAFAGWTLAQTPSGWALGLACLVGLSSCLRIRTCPLTAEVVSLTGATAVVIAGLVDHGLRAAPALWWAATLVAVAVIGAGLLALSYRPPEHVRARVRRVADRVEAVAVVAMVPMAVGVFGVYESLLRTF